MRTFALALKAKGTPVPQIATKLTIKTGKNAGTHPSVASLYRALAEAESARATTHLDEPLPQPPPAASRSTTDGATEAAPTPTVAPSPRACPTCGHEPATRAEAIHQRADLDITWLEPDRDRPGQIATGRHCRSCHPTGPTLDISCAVCGDGPILTASFANASDPAHLPDITQRWLINTGWQISPTLLCPDHS